MARNSMTSRKGILERSCPAGKLSQNGEKTSTGRLERTWLLRKENAQQSAGSRRSLVAPLRLALELVHSDRERSWHRPRRAGEPPSGCPPEKPRAPGPGRSEVTGELHRAGALFGGTSDRRIRKGNGRLQRPSQSLCCVASAHERHKAWHSKKQWLPVSQWPPRQHAPSPPSLRVHRTEPHQRSRPEHVHRKRFLTWRPHCVPPLRLSVGKREELTKTKIKNDIKLREGNNMAPAV